MNVKVKLGEVNQINRKNNADDMQSIFKMMYDHDFIQEVVQRWFRYSIYWT